MVARWPTIYGALRPAAAPFLPVPPTVTTKLMEHRQLLSGFIRIHILFHASKKPFYGAWMIEELAHHDYKVSAGTLYPMLHSMEQRGYLTSTTARGGGSSRRVYRMTRLGRQALSAGKAARTHRRGDGGLIEQPPWPQPFK